MTILFKRGVSRFQERPAELQISFAQDDGFVKGLKHSGPIS
jgi:hypothetical protein